MGNPNIEVIKEGNCIKKYNYITNIYASVRRHQSVLPICQIRIK